MGHPPNEKHVGWATRRWLDRSIWRDSKLHNHSRKTTSHRFSSSRFRRRFLKNAINFLSSSSTKRAKRYHQRVPRIPNQIRGCGESHPITRSIKNEKGASMIMIGSKSTYGWENRVTTHTHKCRNGRMKSATNRQRNTPPL